MEKIEFEGEIYYFLNNTFVDQTFCRVSDELSKKLANNYFKKDDYLALNKDELLEYVKKMKEAEQFSACRDACLYGLKNYENDEEFIKKILPIITSVYRALKQPSLAISVAQNYTDLYKCDSAPLWTSVSAAFCDVGDYNSCLKFIKLAIKKQRQTKTPSPELAEVLKRVAKSLNMTNEEIKKYVLKNADEDEDL
ncbi:MAG: hypothetical protein IJ837_01345 [Clostridia bacterium]|nr:hypothetical protein [Clostridia bacterium]